MRNHTLLLLTVVLSGLVCCTDDTLKSTNSRSISTNSNSVPETDRAPSGAPLPDANPDDPANGGSSNAPDRWPSVSQLFLPDPDPNAVRAAYPNTPSVDWAWIEPGKWRCQFNYIPDEPIGSVALAGDFNNWSKTANEMSPDPDSEAWYALVELEEGTYRYKFVVNGSEWIADPQCVYNEPDGHDGMNSVLMLGRVANIKTSPASRGDSNIDYDGIAHDPDAPMYFQPLESGRAVVRLRSFDHDLEQVKVDVQGHGVTPMHPALADGKFEYWEATIPIDEQTLDNDEVELSAKYVFILQDGTRNGYYPKEFAVTFKPARAVRTPDWPREAIFYQIMLDRFRNGDPANDPPNVHPWTSDWFAAQPYEEAKEGQSFYKWFVFDRMYGGDIAGLREKLPYLKELGITSLYLNPVFEADGHHKYNATNFVHIDDEFGTRGDYEAAIAEEDLLDPETWTWTETDKLFLALIEDVHKQGMTIIIDGVFNHVGTNHPAFVDVKEKGKDSRFADWFAVKSWEPFEYEGWAGHDSLPVFAKTANGLASEAAKKHIFDITRRWMDPNNDGDPRDGIDGWRLDVPNEIALPFWAEWRELVKSINPEAYITGEIWDRADVWLDGKHFDAVMNYQFAEPVIAWATFDKKKIAPTELDRTLARLRLAYPQACTYVLQNLVDSHDTDRLASMARNPDRKYDNANRTQDSGPNYDNAKPTAEEFRKARLVALVQMTYVGAPMIYYGDEVGMWGADDPTCRKPMLWKDLEPYEKPEENHVMDEQLAFYKNAIALRHKHGALRLGEFQTLLADDEQDVWVFTRYDDREALIVAMCAGKNDATVQVQLPRGFAQEWQRVFGDSGAPRVSANQDGIVTLQVPHIGGVVYQARFSRKGR
ncbi:MAG: alpha-amylase family glycosyl hydrolase [Phycisphaerae bacterium]